MWLENNILLYKTLLIFKGTLLAAFVFCFEPVYDFIILSTLPESTILTILSQLKELIGVIVAILIAIKLILQINKLNKDK